MPKREYNEDDYIISEHGNWNVASDYSKLKIFKPMYLSDEYETIATFGFNDFIDELGFSGSIDHLKIAGFRRLVKALLLVINNSKFAVKGAKQPGERWKLERYAEELKRFYKIIPTLYFYRTNQQTKNKELVINQEKYEQALERVVELKSKINEPLNRYDLIYSHKDEIDYVALKKSIIEDATTRG